MQTTNAQKEKGRVKAALKKREIPRQSSEMMYVQPENGRDEDSRPINRIEQSTLTACAKTVAKRRAALAAAVGEGDATRGRAFGTCVTARCDETT